MSDKTYNGWANYATWRVNLEILDGIELSDYGWQNLDNYELSIAFKEYTQEIIDQSPDGLAKDYAMAFLSDVNWVEIANSAISNTVES